MLWSRPLLQQALSLEVVVHFTVDHVAGGVLKLLLLVCPPPLHGLLAFQLGPHCTKGKGRGKGGKGKGERREGREGERAGREGKETGQGRWDGASCNLTHTALTLLGVLHTSDIRKVGCVWYPQSPHAVCMLPLREVALEGLGPPVGGVTADLAGVAEVESMELVEPVGDWLQVRSSTHDRSLTRAVTRGHMHTGDRTTANYQSARAVTQCPTFPSQPKGRFFGL